MWHHLRSASVRRPRLPAVPAAPATTLMVSTRVAVPVLAAGVLLTAACVLLPHYLRPDWWARGGLAFNAVAGTVLAGWIVRFGVSARRVLPLALCGDAAIVLSVPALVDRGGAAALTVLFVIPTLLVALFSRPGPLIVQTAAAVLSSAAMLGWAHDGWPALLVHVTCAAYANVSLAAVVLVLRIRLDRALARERTMATTDPLTAIANRRGLEARLPRLAGHAADRRLPVGVLVCDVDHFKRVNDGYGHRVGDQVLRRIAEVIGSCVQGEHVLARLGGEEFAVVVALAPDALAALAEQIRTRVARECLPWAVTLSVGAAWGWPDGDRTVDETWGLIDHADDLMFGAKRAGRDQVRLDDRPVIGRTAGIPAFSRTSR